MPVIVRMVTAAAVAASLLAVPTGAIAASPAAPRTAASAANAVPANPWLTLSAMTSTSSSAATAAAAAQDDDGGLTLPPIGPLIVILGTIALGVYILLKDDDDDGLDFPITPVSP